jgi:protein TonB
MLNVLLESKARRTRRVGGTVMSALVHGALLAGAVLLTMPPERMVAAAAPTKPHDIYYIPIRRPPEPTIVPTRHPERSTQPTTVTQPEMPSVSLVVPNVPQTEVTITRTPDDFGTRMPGQMSTDRLVGRPTELSGSSGGVFDERQVERSPRLLGTPAQPTFPPTLRQAGRGGRVLVQFVVDTTGRAEMHGFTVIETTDPLFAESVRNVLPRYRFSPGEAGGRRVRTMVQLPFDFTLVR